MAGYSITQAKYARVSFFASRPVFSSRLVLIYTFDFTYPKTMEQESDSSSWWRLDFGTGLLIPSFILADESIGVEDKFTTSTILQYLIIKNEGRESTALFGELETVFTISEADIVRCVHLLQERELMTCFRDKFNIGGDMTLYVGSETRNAYLKEFNKIKNDTYSAQEK